MPKFFSNGASHLRLPFFQREVVWEKANWQTLFDDILDLYAFFREENPRERFIGSLVVVNEGTVHGTV